MVAEDGPPTVVFFDIGGMKFGLFGKAALAEELARDPGTPGHGATTLAVNWPDEAAVDAAFAHAVEAGGRAVRSPRAMAWGGYSGYWSDPDGHLWEYAYNPFWPLDDDGRLKPAE